jgi:type II secretory pathway component PulL
MTLATLADVRELMRHLPEDRRARSTWRYVEQQLAEAAAGADPADATISLRLALMLEGVECRVQ